MSNVRVRPPEVGDGREMARIWLARAWYFAELDPELSHVPYEEGLAEAFETSFRTRREADELQVVAEGDGHLLGIVEGRLIRADAEVPLLRDAGKPHVLIDSLMVDPTSSRQGIGTRLMEAVESWARQHGATLARVDMFDEGPVSLPAKKAG
jgi:GNAT superfamily N-acetyltransferase